MRRPRRPLPRVALVAIVVVALLAVGVGVRSGVGAWQASHRTPLEQALRLVPADVQRVSWTDWSAVRAKLGSDVGVDSSPSEVRRFLQAGFDRDLTDNSALVDSAPILQAKYGWSPASIEWEAFAQADVGDADLVRFTDDTDMGDVGDALESLGYTRPQDEDGVWQGGPRTLALITSSSIGQVLTPTLQYIALDPARHLLMASDRQGYLRQVLPELHHDHDAPLAPVADQVGQAVTAAVYSGTYTCKALAMAGADRGDQAQGAQLVAAAGEVNPMTGFAMALEPDGLVRLAMSFDDDQQAKVNAQTRARLARGPAPGQGGTFRDRFTLVRAGSQGSVVVMDLRPQPQARLFSDLANGPVLYATC